MSEDKTTTTTTGEATYCPEDDKLRLYVGRVPRDEYMRLRSEGWACLHKQREAGGGDFVAVWTPEREDTALNCSGGVIDDEDKGPADRAADRAERFAGYREKREGEAGAGADGYDAGPQVHGYHSAALAERRANQHDRLATRAVNAWDKAEYWQRRTAGVIGHALYVAAPGVRMGRIKTLEAELRKIEKSSRDATEKNQGVWDIWNSIAGNAPLIVLGVCVYSLHNANVKPVSEDTYTTEQLKLGMALMLNSNVHTEYGSDRYKLQKKNEADLVSGTTKPEEAARLWLTNHPERPQDWTPGGRWYDHIKFRLAYEDQMIEAQGGRLASVEMVAGGWLGKRQIQKVNKSPVTGRVVSVAVWGERRGYTKESGYTKEETRPCLLQIDTERLPPDAYRAPTDEEITAFLGEKKEKKKARAVVPTINPTIEEAGRLQAQWNSEAAANDKGRNYPREAGEVAETTQGYFSEHSGEDRAYGVRLYRGVKFRVRSCGWARVEGVVVLTDKPKKALPAAVWSVAASVAAVALQGDLVLV